jgi:predicted hotdog family 3-hydroxylacyl-ACP dehydratase
MFIPAHTLIPHQEPMRWIDNLIACTDTTAAAEVCFGLDHFAVTDGQVAESALVECMAQTAAAALGYRARASGATGPPAAGMLAAISNFRVERTVVAGECLRIEVCDLKRFGPMLLIAGTIRCQDRPVAQAELTLYA